MVDVTDDIDEVGRRSREVIASPREPRRPLDPAASEVLVRVAHEMRQPLSAITAAINVIKDDTDVSRRAHACQVLERQCTRLSRLVEDLLVVARTGRDITALSKEKVDLHHVLSDLAEALRPSARLRAQQLDVLLSPGPCWVYGDAVRLEQVFSNILNNAIKYTDNAGRIWLTSMPTDHHVVVTIADTGRGIAPDALSRVFEMFTTGPDQAGRGLGVGLAVARHLVMLHGGSIDITSDGRERGTEVVVKLPRVNELALSPAPEPAQPQRTSAAQEHVRRMLDRIERSYSEPITLRSLASELHRQSAYLGGMFRRVVGMSVHQWLTTVRLDRASTLIREGVKVEAVSLLVGYRSKKNFYRQFKRRFGTTPFAHRNMARIES
jgi:AraC-like DNA-binding protein/anti-sigma regulatory factor (Ser/Thr protein kinase)